MKTQSPVLARLSDDDLLAALDRLVRCERNAAADFEAELHFGPRKADPTRPETSWPALDLPGPHGPPG